MLKIPCIIILSLLFSILLSKPVLEITSESYDSLISFNETDNLVIMFFDPTCKFCEKVKPEFIKAGELVSDKLENIVFGTADLEKEYILAHKNEIKFVPSLRLFKKGYDGYIDIKYFSNNEIANFVFRHFHLHTYELKTAKEVADFIRNFDAMGFYYGSEKDPEFQIYKEYLELHENVQITFSHIFNEDIIKEIKLEPKSKIAILRKDNEEDFIYFNESFTLTHLSEFLKMESFPLINPFDQKLMNDLFKTGNGLLVLLKKPNQKKNEKIDLQFKTACSEFRKKIRCASTFSDSDYSGPLLDKLGLSETDLPQVNIFFRNFEKK